MFGAIDFFVNKRSARAVADLGESSFPGAPLFWVKRQEKQKEEGQQGKQNKTLRFWIRH